MREADERAQRRESSSRSTSKKSGRRQKIQQLNALVKLLFKESEEEGDIRS
jgi:hypothetical protein